MKMDASIVLSDCLLLILVGKLLRGYGTKRKSLNG